MKPEICKSRRPGKPKRKGKLSGSKRRMLAMAKERKLITSPKLSKIYSAETEWARKVIPDLKEQKRKA